MTPEQHTTAAVLLDTARRKQSEYWAALETLEYALGVAVPDCHSFVGVTVEDLVATCGKEN